MLCLGCVIGVIPCPARLRKAFCGTFSVNFSHRKFNPQYELSLQISSEVSLHYVRPDLGDRANAAYKNNLVYKNAYSAGNGGAGVDEKRVIDLSPARLDTIVSVDAGLGEEIGAPLLDSVRFFDRVRTEVAPKLLEAVSQVVGDPTLVKDNLTNYRFVT